MSGRRRDARRGAKGSGTTRGDARLCSVPAVGTRLAGKLLAITSERAQVYRYRTGALVGAWQPTIGAALDDAIQAGQTQLDDNGRVQWVVPGEIEEGSG